MLAAEELSPSEVNELRVAMRAALVPEEAPPAGYGAFAFEIARNDSEPGSDARRGRLVTPHGVVETPNFIFCGTKATVKGLTAEQVRSSGAQFVLANTYHLMLQPGGELVEELGGLQKMTGWEGPMLTDSGGYQVFSMGFGSVSNEVKGSRDTEQLGWKKSLIKIDEHGATFRSYRDGSIQVLTAERSMEVQRQLGADIVLVFDECTPFKVAKSYTASSMRRSHRWARRSIRAFGEHDDGRQALYGIIQGGVYDDLRNESVAFANSQPYFGVAIGGSLGADKGDMYRVVAHTARLLRKDRPVHLLGIGGVADIFHGVRQGIDTFDCVHPTRIGRHGCALVMAKHWDEYTDGESKKPAEHVNLGQSRFRGDPRPIDDECSCYTCRTHSRAYLHHLLKSDESVGGSLISLHNVAFMSRLMAAIREAIADEDPGALLAEEARWVQGASCARKAS